jgi:tripeptidyl-peptidase-1
MQLSHQIATPGHALYGNHLSQHVIDAMVAPRDESSDLVIQWIETEGLGDHATISPRSDSVIVEASVSQIEKLLNAEYAPFGKSAALT